VKYNIVGYLIKEGFSNTFKNKKSTFAALIIMIATMIVFGVFFSITKNINNMITELEHSQGIQVFMLANTPQQKIDEIGQKIKALDGVNSVKFVSKEDAMNQMKDNFADYADLLNGLEDVLPPSYLVTFTDLSKNYEVQNEINSWKDSGYPEISKIQNKDDTTNALLNVGNWINIVSTAILAFLVIVSIFIISNTIKLTVHARRKEISIMKYVGATNSFIRWPFVVEGIIIGVVAAIISLVVIGFAYNAVIDKLMTLDLMSKLGVVFVNFTDMLNLILIVYAILGIGIGVVGSMISMKRYLEV